MIREVKRTTPERLRDLADFLDEHGIGMGDHSDRPLIEDAADTIERLRAAVVAAEAYILSLRQIVYSAVPGVPEAAWARVDMEGSRWCELSRIDAVGANP